MNENFVFSIINKMKGGGIQLKNYVNKNLVYFYMKNTCKKQIIKQIIKQ